MLKVGNDNVAIRLIDVEYAFSDYAVAFPIKYGIYFLTIKTLYEGLDYQYTIVFNVGANIVENTIIHLGPVDPNNNFAILAPNEQGVVVGILGAIAPQGPEDIISFKYIPEE